MTQASWLILWWRNICILSVSFKHLENLQELFPPVTSHYQTLTTQKICMFDTVFLAYLWVFKRVFVLIAEFKILF